MRLGRVKRPKALWWQALHPDGLPVRQPARIRPRSDRMARAMRVYCRMARGFLRQNPTCQFPGCREPSREVHHSRGRVGVLLLLVQFWRAVCSSHHRWIGEHPVEARELGLLCNVGEWNCPPTTPEP